MQIQYHMPVQGLQGFSPNGSSLLFFWESTAKDVKFMTRLLSTWHVPGSWGAQNEPRYPEAKQFWS
jgi:hypothetical protein